MPNTTHEYITQCRCCGGANLVSYLNLKNQPLANNFHARGEPQQEFPLNVMLCRDCFHSQLSVVVDPKILFEHYLYVSGTSQTLKDYCEFFADMAVGLSSVEYGTVLDIASNDGSQLDSFRSMGWTTYGVDPAQNLTPLAIEKGHHVITDFWNDRTVGQLQEGTPSGTVDIITAQNVFAHTHDILSFLLNCKNVMHEQSLLLIQTSQCDMFRNGEFDTIYHEHLSFFNIQSMLAILKRAGLVLETVVKTEIHGGSYVFVISLRGDVTEFNNVPTLFAEEAKAGLYTERTYHEFGRRANDTVHALVQRIREYKAKGYRVVGYGAAAKGMTVLNFGGLNFSDIDYIVDDNPLKVGLLTPGSDIEIKHSGVLRNDPHPCMVILPLAWNFFVEISRRVIELRPTQRDLFIRYFPHLYIVTTDDLKAMQATEQ